MRWDVGCHTDGDAFAPVDQQVRESGGQHLWLPLALVVVGGEVDGAFIQVRQQQHGRVGQAGLGITLGGRAIAIDAAKITLTVDQRQAQAEGLRQANHGHVDRKVAMRMVLAHHVTGDTRALAIGFVRRVAAFVHGIENAAMHRLHAVPRIRQRPADDDGHGVVKERAPHLGLDHHGGRGRRLVARWRRRRKVRRRQVGGGRQVGDGWQVGHCYFQGWGLALKRGRFLLILYRPPSRMAKAAGAKRGWVDDRNTGP